MTRNRSSSTSKTKSTASTHLPVPAQKLQPPAPKIMQTHAPTQNSFASSMAGSMAGFLAGNYIANKMFGSNNTQEDNSFLKLKKCIEENPNDYNMCKYYIDNICENMNKL
jgi:predicted lipid-binding transport protein (Tim44 family)